MSNWERNEIVNEWQDEEIARYKEQFRSQIKKRPVRELTEREKWLTSMPEEDSIKILLAEQKELEFSSHK